MLFLGGSFLPITGGTLTGYLNGSGCNFLDFQSGGSFLWYFGKGVGSQGNTENYYGFLNNNYWDGRMVKIGVSADISAYGFNDVSDIRKKNIIQNIELDINSVAEAPLFKFKWNDELDNTQHLGTSAQYWKDVTPELVSEASDEMHTLSMQYGVIALASVISVAKKVIELEKLIKGG